MKTEEKYPGVFVSWWVLLFSIAVGGCGKMEAPVVATPSAPAASTPVVSAPASGHIVNLAQGSDLALFSNQQMIHPQFFLGPPAAESPLIFAVVQNDLKHAAAPVILRKAGAAWKISELGDAPQQEWAYVASGPAAQELWGVLDAAGESEIDHLTLVHSTDGGNAWQFFVTIQKVSSNADYAGFSLAKSGQGRLTMHLTEDDEQIRHGYYHYTTTDGGKSWRGPGFEPDDTAEGDSLKSNTLPEALRDAK